MSYMNKFPPNRFLTKHITPGRLIVGVVAFIVLEIVGGIYFPRQLADGAFYFLCAFLPVMLGLIIWEFVWMIRHPAPPRQQCPTCDQYLPEKDNE